MPSATTVENGAAAATVPLAQYLATTHEAALKEAGALAARWESLEGRVDSARFEGVRARFAQQVNDAQVFSDTILNYYAHLRSGS